MTEWQPIETAPKDGTRIRGRVAYIAGLQDKAPMGKLCYRIRKTFWGKTSHVPLYGWVYGRQVENLDLWSPTHWMPLPEPPKDDASPA